MEKFLVYGVALLWAFGVRAATVVDCTESSLKAAVAAGGTVNFSCSGTIFLTSPVVVTQSVTLDASFRQITLSGGSSNRLFNVTTNGDLTLRFLTITGGWNPVGGAISNSGSLRIESCTFSNNTARQFGAPTGAFSGRGGAIYNSPGAKLQVSNSRFRENLARGNDGTAVGFSIGGHGHGGSLCSDSAALFVTNCVFERNLVLGGNGATNNFGYSAGQGVGGAIYARTGSVSIVGCSFSDNRAEGGAAGAGMEGGLAAGGALGLLSDVSAVVLQCAFSGNEAQGGEGWKQTPIRGGGDASGGAIYREPQRTVITNCTFFANRANGGSSLSNTLSSSGQGHGGAVAGFGVLAFCTLASNSVASGLGCYLLPTGSGTQVGQAYGCIYGFNQNAGNMGLTIDLGYNIATDSAGFTNVTSRTNADPKLGPFANNGSGVSTMALLPASLALDFIPASNTNLPPTDARGIARPAGAGGDAGAFELNLPSSPHIIAQRGGQQSVMITTKADAGHEYALLGSTNFVEWTTNGSVLMTTNGLLELEIGITNSTAVYRLLVR